MKKTISEKQHKANQLNAKKGGAKTPKGKDIVRFNARKHGILANLVTEDEKDFFEKYKEQLFDDLQPNSVLENILVERIAIHYLKLFRLAKTESTYIKNCLATDIFYSEFSEEEKQALSSCDMKDLLEIYGRYETNIENRLYKAMKEYKHIKQPS